LRPLGLVGVFGAIGAVVGHYMAYGPKGAPELDVAELPAPREPANVAIERARTGEDIAVGEEIVRHRLSTRVIHWTVAVSFFVTLLSGLPIWTPIFGWMAHLFGGLAVCRWLHPIAGLVFAGAILIMFVHWLGDMRFGPEDRGWMYKMLNYFRHTDEDPTVGKYNAGQKFLFFLVAVLAVLLLLSGIVMWYPYEFTEDLRQASWVLHDAMFILFALTIVGHIYLATAAEPGTFRAMTRGTVTKAWARIHHPRWFRDVTGERTTERP
jgi:formate dehydrogenase subunit gamma